MTLLILSIVRARCLGSALSSGARGQRVYASLKKRGILDTYRPDGACLNVRGTWNALRLAGLNLNIGRILQLGFGDWRVLLPWGPCHTFGFACAHYCPYCPRQAAQVLHRFRVGRFAKVMGAPLHEEEPCPNECFRSSSTCHAR